MPRLKGTVIWFSERKGFGFIKPAVDGKDVFFHHTQVPKFEELDEGDVVIYSLGEGRKPGSVEAKDVFNLSLWEQQKSLDDLVEHF